MRSRICGRGSSGWSAPQANDGGVAAGGAEVSRIEAASSRLDLGGRFVADDDEAVPSSEDAAGPAAQPSDFARDVGSSELAEAHELVLGAGNHEQMQVVAQHDHGAEGEAEDALGASEDADDEVVEPTVGSEQERAWKVLSVTSCRWPERMVLGIRAMLMETGEAAIRAHPESSSVRRRIL